MCRETSTPSPSTTVVQWATIHFVVGLRPIPMAVARSGENERLTAYSELPVGIFVSRARIFCRDERIYRRCAAFSRSAFALDRTHGHGPPFSSSPLFFTYLFSILLLGARRGRDFFFVTCFLSTSAHVSCSTPAVPWPVGRRRTPGTGRRQRSRQP